MSFCTNLAHNDDVMNKYLIQCSEVDHTSKKTGISVIGDDGKVRILKILILLLATAKSVKRCTTLTIIVVAAWSLCSVGIINQS